MSRLRMHHSPKATADLCVLQNVGFPGPTGLSQVTTAPIRLLPQLLIVLELEPARLRRAV